MKMTAMSTMMSTIVLGVLGSSAVFCQAPAPAAPRTGPGVQAPQDAKYQDLIKTCKVPPPTPPGRGGAAKGGQAKGPAPAAAGPKDVTITAIPGVIAAGQQWKEIWKVEGNNADGIVATKDGGILAAQNDNSTVVKMDKDGKVSNAYTGLNTSGSVAMNGKNLFVLNRGLNQSIEQLEPQRKTLVNKNNGDPLDCLGGTLNDLVSDSKGGVYFTMGGVFHADSKGTITKYGENVNPNGIVLSPDEKHLYVTNGATLAAFDVQKDGSLTNQREFAKLEAGGGGDGSTFDSTGRLYVTAQANGIQVFDPAGKYLGVIPTPRPVITVTFSGPDRKTLYAVSRTGNTDWIIGIQMIAQGPKGRGK
jgi:gluconolactonase